MTERQSPKKNLLAWALTQLGVFFRFVVEMLLVGAIIAIVKKRFSYRSFTAGLLTMVVGLGVTSAWIFGTSQGQLREAREWVFWALCFAVMAVAGAVAGRAGRRIAFWELYLATLVTVAVVVVQLAWGWDSLLGLGPSDTQAYLELLGNTQPGIRLLGPMWDRLVGLAAVGGFLTAVFGSSAAYLLFGEEGRFQPGFDIEWFIARRHLSGSGTMASVTAVVAIIGIALGVAALVAVTAVMSGYQQDVQDKILSTNAHLVIQKYGIDFVEYPQISEKALAVDGVLAATPFSFNEAMLSDGELGVGVLLKGIVPETAGAVTAVEENLCADIEEDGTCHRGGDSRGRLVSLLRTDEGGLPHAILGAELFKKLRRPVGSIVTMTTPVGIAGARGNAPKRMDFRIAGAFRSGMHEFDSRLIYLNLPDAQKLMGLGDAVNGVEFRVDEPQNVDLIARGVLSAAGRYPYRTLDWRELNAGIFTALKLQKIVMFLVLCFIVVVASFNIASTLFMTVVERSREIGVLKSMGARDASIMKVFVLEGWVVGGVGTFLGVVLGLAVCGMISELDIGIAADVYMVDSLEVMVRPTEVTMTAIAALAISHLATLHPALKAARQAPVDAMRYE